MLATNHNTDAPMVPLACRGGLLPRKRRIPTNTGDAPGAWSGPTPEVQIGDASVAPFGYTSSVLPDPSGIQIGTSSIALVDGHAVPSIFSVSLLASTKVAKLMDTLSRIPKQCGAAKSIQLASRRNRLFSTRVLRNNQRKSSSINKSAKIGRHTFCISARNTQ